MTPTEKQLLISWESGRLSTEGLLKQFPYNLHQEFAYIREEIITAMQNLTLDQPEASDDLDLAFDLIQLSNAPHQFTDLLNELLITPNHTQHQATARILQEIKSPTTIPFVKTALATNFDYLQYTCSESSAIAKWFSWLLFAINTPEAIALIREYTQSHDQGIRQEMQYRLRKWEQSQPNDEQSELNQ